MGTNNKFSNKLRFSGKKNWHGTDKRKVDTLLFESAQLLLPSSDLVRRHRVFVVLWCVKGVRWSTLPVPLTNAGLCRWPAAED